MYESVSDVTAQSITVLRRMRSATLQSSTREADETLARSLQLARAVGQLVLASTLGQDLAERIQTLKEQLEQEESRYGRFGDLSRRQYPAEVSAEGALQWADRLNTGIQEGQFHLSRLFETRKHRRHTSAQVATMLESPPTLVAALSTDLVHASITNAFMGHYFGKEFPLVPAAPDTDGRGAVLPSQLPAGELRLYLDAEREGHTQSALIAGLADYGVAAPRLI